MSHRSALRCVVLIQAVPLAWMSFIYTDPRAIRILAFAVGLILGMFVVMTSVDVQDSKKDPK